MNANAKATKVSAMAVTAFPDWNRSIISMNISPYDRIEPLTKKEFTPTAEDHKMS
jgi:hypothetical protein